MATVHSDSAYHTIDRLITLVKREERATAYQERFIGKMLAGSIDYIIFMDEFSISQIIEVKYLEQQEKIVLNSLFKKVKINVPYFERWEVYKEGNECNS